MRWSAHPPRNFNAATAAVQDYASLCRPELLEEDPALFYGFWGHCYNRYRASPPHSGYSILRRWCTDVLPRPTGTAASNHWVYSSNVDGHFRRVGFEHSCLLELHGNCAEHPGWFCPTCSAAQLGGSSGLTGVATPPPGYEFPVEPETMTVPDVPSAAGNEAAAGSTFGKGWPRCTAAECNGLLRPAVHMFAEDSGALLSWLAKEEERYVEWECAMENDIVDSIPVDNDGNTTTSSNTVGCGPSAIAATDAAHADAGARAQLGTRPKRVVLLELGCGLTVPSVRMEMECVLRDLTERISPGTIWTCKSCGGVNLKGTDSPSVCYKCRAANLDSQPSEASVSRTAQDSLRRRCGESAGVLLVRVNPQFPQNPGWEDHTIEVRAGARVALEKIDAALLEMGR
jgi:NAD-dependent SIR2 family protein deacetylase